MWRRPNGRTDHLASEVLSLDMFHAVIAEVASMADAMAATCGWNCYAYKAVKAYHIGRHTGGGAMMTIVGLRALELRLVDEVLSADQVPRLERCRR